MTRADFLELLNRKKIYSRFSHRLVEFVPSLDNLEDTKHGVYSDGMVLIDYEANATDDIQYMYFDPKIPKIHKAYNMEDF